MLPITLLPCHPVADREAGAPGESERGEEGEGEREADDRLTFVLVCEWEERRGKFEQPR